LEQAAEAEKFRAEYLKASWKAFGIGTPIGKGDFAPGKDAARRAWSFDSPGKGPDEGMIWHPSHHWVGDIDGLDAWPRLFPSLVD
jgi:hypothetical protein